LVNRRKDGGWLEINVRDDMKFVEVWLTRSESQDEQFKESLRPLYQEYKAKKYKVAVFHSGERDVWDAASDLICYNRKRIAELEVRREREQREQQSEQEARPQLRL